ncbi:two-component system chemotaxis response regulator CheB [Alkalibaculum bacchi]|uniref:Protein-glutamate methylesterase/protein-glutamine glutaminase n=1 Tax=Alkalibaculum bacchi TaxID=645887 RepID=A0A366II51_9FIRM|nr:chemotaxis response regulator protein-glutamate methylesterase [Alkalibaculum bacchi]RBP70135.1 two-component system chemotaxis response regulator CheB [Alkalibaculum bacchi]
MNTKLLIVDDSAFMRKVISDSVKEMQGIEVAGIARDGLDALEIIPKLKPDIITLDVEMPKLNGLETLKIIKEKYNIPVIMISSHTGADITIEALQIGAVDFIEKPQDIKSNLGDLKVELENKIKSVLGKRESKHFNKQNNSSTSYGQTHEIEAVVIGASTGGPKALTQLIHKLPSKARVPIFIVQHMPKGFTTSFAARLDRETSLKVVEAEEGMLIQAGTVYLAPGDFHMTIDKNRIRLNKEDKIYGVRPAVDYLFSSAAKVYKNKLLAVIMTGMGRDGTIGLKEIKKAGGYTIAQSEESCVVFGMPGHAISSNVIDKIMNLPDIASSISRHVGVLR